MLRLDHARFVWLLVTAAAWGSGCAPQVSTPLGRCRPLPLGIGDAAQPDARRAAWPSDRRATRARKPPPVVLIRGATVWTAGKGIKTDTDVLLAGGKIAAVGRGLQVPAGATVISGKGKHLTPGLIDAHSHLGVYAVPNLRGHSDGNEIGKPVTPQVRAADGFFPQDPGISRGLAAGVTTALIVPGSTNLIGGRGFTIKLIPGLSAAELRFPGAPDSMKMACGENPKRVYARKGGPFSRMGSVARVRAALRRAVEYRRTWRRYRAKRARWEKRRARACRPKATSAPDRKARKKLPPKPPRTNPGLEALVDVLSGKLRVQWHCYRADEMLLMMRLAKRFGFTVAAFHHATETYKIRRALKRYGTAAVTFVNWWGYKAEAFDMIPENAAMLLADGVLVALHTDSPQVIQRYNQEAGLAYYRGRQMGLRITQDDALKLVTLNAAKVLGIDRVTGSIDKGKMADVTLWDGHPFSVYTRAERVFVDGHPVYHRQGNGRRSSDFELGLVPRPAPLSRAAPPAAQKPPPWPAALRPKRGKGPVVAIVGGRVHAMTGRPPARATVLLQGDRILGVSPGLAVPRGAKIIDAKGRVVTPGFIAAETTLGVVGISAEPSTRDNDAPKYKHPIRAALRIWDALNPRSVAIPVNRIEGFTTAVLGPRGGIVSGQGVAYDLAGIKRKQRNQLAPAAVFVSLGIAGAIKAGGNRALALLRLRRLLADTRLYKKRKAAVEARRIRRLSASVADLAAMVPVVEQKIPLVVRVHRASDIRAVLRLAKEEKIRVVLSGAAEAWRVAKDIARAKVGVLVDGDLNLPRSFETLGGRFDNAARLHRAGVQVAFSGGGGSHNIRFLRQVAGIAVAWGLPHTGALSALTSVPAQLFGLKDRGVLRPGARANVVVWTGDPLELKTRVQHLFIGGKAIPLTSRQTLLRERYRSAQPLAQ